MSTLELTALPPLSPTMERAFTEAFAEMSELEKSDTSPHIKLESPQDVWSSSDDDDMVKKKNSTFLPETPQVHKSVIHTISPCGKQTDINEIDAKRARRSAIEKKSRQRRQNVLKRMRDEVKQLETRYAELDGKQRGSFRVENGEKQCGNSVTIDRLEEKFSELSLVAHALEEDQVKLQTLLQQYQEFQKTVQGFTDEKIDEKKHVWNCGVPLSSSFSATFKALTVAECYSLVRKSYDEIQRFNDAEHFQTTGANFMGWTDKRKYDSKTGALQYGFTKKFWMHTPEDLLTRTWDIFLDGPRFKNMSFDSSVNARYEVLQQLNDDLRIVRRDHRIRAVDVTFATIQLIFRLQTPTGYTLCMRTIPAPEIQCVQDSHEYFYEIFHWTHFNRLYDDEGKPTGCEIVTGGSIADQQQIQSSFWLFELVCSLLRWETACVAPLFLKHS
ncbi:hypothetical protein Plhal304r1_c021g0074991 [Plasmopara halstedii]